MIDSQVALVSGGSRGLGAAAVEALIQKGFVVASFSRSKTPFIESCLETHSGSFFWAKADAADPDSLKTFVGQSLKQFGRIDALINNAGANLDQLLAMTGEADIRRILSINLEATILLTKWVTRAMLARGRGRIVNISSILGHRGFKGTSVYSASKAALDGLTRSLARELGSRGITVNAISPGFIETDMTLHMPEGQRAQIIRRTPLGRLGQVEDITGALLFLLSKQAQFITGQSLVIDGGLTC